MSPTSNSHLKGDINNTPDKSSSITFLMMLFRRTSAHILAAWAVSSLLSAGTGKILTHYFHGYFDNKHWTWTVYFEFGNQRYDWQLLFLLFVILFLITPLVTALRIALKSPLLLLEHRWGFVTSALTLFTGTIWNVQVASFYLLSGMNTIAPF